MRRILIAGAALAVLALPAYAGYWLYVASELRQGLAPWAEASRAQGLALAWQGLAVEGFPLAFRVRLSGASLAATRPLPYAAQSDEVVLTASPFDLRDWRFAAPRGVALRMPTRFAAIDAATLAGSLAIAGDATIVSVSAQDLTGRDAAQGLAADALETEITVPAHPPENHRDTALALTARLRGLRLPQPQPPLPPRFDDVALAATLKGRLPPGPLARGLAAWRDDGGTLELERAHLAWGTTVIDLGGTLALDAALQPTGALTATVTGAEALVDGLVAAGIIEKRYAGAAKAVLRAISAPAGGGDALRLPLTVQEQRLFIGPAPVAALPHIDWQ